MAEVCRSVCMVTCLALSEGQLVLARATWWARRRSIASRLRRLPVMVGNSGSLGAPGRSPSQAVQDRFGGRHQRCASFFAAFADGVHVGAGGERDVFAGECGEFGDPQSGLDGESEHGVVAPAGPGALVAGAQQRVDLGLGEVGEEVAFGSFGRDGEHALDGAGVFGVVQGEVAEQRVDRGQAVVAGGGAVVPVAFEVVEERGDQRRVEVGDVQGAGRLAECDWRRRSTAAGR